MSLQCATGPVDKEESYLDLNAEQMDMLKERFNAADADGTAGLDRLEILRLWEQMWPEIPIEDVRLVTDDLFSDIDVNGDGQVTFTELQEYLRVDTIIMSDIDKYATGEVQVKDRPKGFKEWIWASLDEGGPHFTEVPWVNKICAITNCFIQLAILTSVGNMMVESMPQYQEKNNPHIFAIEATCIAIFSVELCLRVISAPERKEYLKSVLTWVDILAVLPFYVGLAGAGSGEVQVLIVLRVLRLLRLLRVVKLGARFQGVQLLLLTIQRAGDALLLSTLLINVVAVTVFASLMFTFERGQATFDTTQQKWIRDNDSDYDDAGQVINFQSIPDSMWWAWVTLTTVGYGDSYPRTTAGKIIASITMLTGFVLVAFPITLLSNSLQTTVHEVDKLKAKKARKVAFNFNMQKNVTETEKSKTEGSIVIGSGSDMEMISHKDINVEGIDSNVPPVSPKRRTSRKLHSDALLASRISSLEQEVQSLSGLIRSFIEDGRKKSIAYSDTFCSEIDDNDNNDIS